MTRQEAIIAAIADNMRGADGAVPESIIRTYMDDAPASPLPTPRQALYSDADLDLMCQHIAAEVAAGKPLAQVLAGLKTALPIILGVAKAAL